MTSRWQTGNYLKISAGWPTEGRHILAQYDADTVTVYQAYRASIAKSAVDQGRFGGNGFSFDRMSWIKPNFLWMMYRSGWGTKPNQEVTLAVCVRREFFDMLLQHATGTAFWPEVHESREAWKSSMRRSEVRIQWDPDRDPIGAGLNRRALQLGLRGTALRGLGGEAVVSIRDVSEFVSSQRSRAQAGDWNDLVVPRERVYLVSDPEARRRLRLDL